MKPLSKGVTRTQMLVGWQVWEAAQGGPGSWGARFLSGAATLCPHHRGQMGGANTAQAAGQLARVSVLALPLID